MPIRIALTMLIMFFGVIGLTAGEVAMDSVMVYFHVAKHDLDTDYRGNGERLLAIREAMARLDAEGTPVDSILITAYASPEGPSDFNARLAKRRMATLRGYLVDSVGIDGALIRNAGEGVAWQGLAHAVATRADVPQRERVLDIIENVPVWVHDADGRVVDSRKKRLMELGGGEPYRWLLVNIFPTLRNSAAIIVYTRHPKPQAYVPDIPDIVPTVACIEVVEAAPVTAIADAVDAHIPVHRFALKTNFVYDALLVPTLEFEWRFNDRWSASVEGSLAWWSHTKQHKYYQLLNIDPEVRYWFKTSAPWHGMYCGVFAGGGKYDLENGDTGYKGEHGMAGVSYGYMWPIGRNLSLEAAIGVGFLYSRYEEYIPFDGHYVYQYSRTLTYVGPLKLKFAIAWRFHDINRKKGGSPKL